MPVSGQRRSSIVMPEDRPSSHPQGALPSADDPDATYTIDDLTTRTGVTVRTVRYYIGEGLLPPPFGAGPGTRYTREHLDRLLLIGALKDRYLPLREIRRQLQEMDADGVREAVEGLHRREDGARPMAAALRMAPAPPEDTRADQDHAPSSALSYIDALLREEPGGITRGPHPGQPRRSSQGRQEHREHGEIRFPGAAENRTPDMFPLPDDLGERRWRRLAITPEAELTIEDELYHRRRDQIDALIAHIRRVLASS